MRPASIVTFVPGVKKMPVTGDWPPDARTESTVGVWPQLKPIKWALHQTNERSLKISPAFSELHWLVFIILDADCVRPVKPRAERILMQYWYTAFCSF